MGDKMFSTLTLFLLTENIEKEFNNFSNNLSDITNISDSENDELEDILSLNVELELIYSVLMVGEIREEIVFTEKNRGIC